MKRLAEANHSAHAHLRGALHLIEKSKGKPTVEMLDQIRQAVRTAVDVLLEPDAFKQRIAFILLTIKMSTKVSEVKGTAGKLVHRVTITDQVMYSWAMAQVHKIAEA